MYSHNVYDNLVLSEIMHLETIEQAWDGDELKIDDGNVRVWLTCPANRPYNGYYTIERLIDGRWVQESF